MKKTLRYLAGVPGPSGYGSNSTAEQVTQQDCSFLLPSSQAQLTALVTGATSGIGTETARVLAKRGARVVIPARDLKKAAEVKESIQKETPEAEIILLEIDLSSFASVKRFCSEFLSLGLPLNILINNAGKFSQELEFSEDKIEMTFATNYLGNYVFLFTFSILASQVKNETLGELKIVDQGTFFICRKIKEKGKSRLETRAATPSVMPKFNPTPIPHLDLAVIYIEIVNICAMNPNR
ncbi:short-chain dehydrogenase TIC 32, chloroplastic-like [Camellia sinensis]|uniref:short-chain dehydrogenase TIC 32, chloroplastic-like n=1 Tax=Camellia sinensis TaxID=4442 RepID=UPI001035C664|nr:short-chain dehydrogenase TIC 32, chloroplastic-like [Camellia sinensis]